MQALNPRQQAEVKHLISLMKDPRYWRERDPALVQTVRTGLRRIYLGEPQPAGRARPLRPPRDGVASPLTAPR